MTTYFCQCRIKILLFILLFSPINISVAAEFGRNFEQITTIANTPAPTVTLTGNSTVQNNQQLSLTANATYCESCVPFYYWHASGGSFQGTENSPNVTWIPPVTNTSQSYNIFVVVGDGNGKIASADLPVTVTNAVNACTASVNAPNLYSGGLWTESTYVTIDWQQVNNATSYVVEESTSSDFANFTQYTNTGAENRSLILYNKTNGTYYYRVKAKNSCGESGWSNVSTRVVKVNAPPNTPSNPSPANSSSSASRTPTLTWSGGDTDGQAEYAIEIGTDPNNMWFTQGYGDANSYSTSKLIDWSLNPSTTYYWRVRSQDDRGVKVLGPTWSFTTANYSADLVPISATVTGTIANDNTVTMKVVVQNQGDYASDGGVLRFYYSPYENGNDRQYPGRWSGLPVLQPGASTTINMDLPISGLLSGASYLVAKVDTYLMMTERDVSNNTISYAINYTDTQNPVISYFDFRYPVNGTLKTNSNASFVYTVHDDIAVSSVDLFCSSNNGVSWSPVVLDYPVFSNEGYGVGTYNWTIPADTPLNNTFKVKVVAKDSSGNMSNSELGPYTIIDGSTPVVSITAPAQGEVWDLNSTHTINWSAVSPNGIHEIRLTYYYNNGNSATSIVNLAGNPGSYSWTLPAAATYASTNCQIVLDVIDNNFNSVRVKSSYFTTRDASAPPSAPWITPSKITTVPSISTSYTSQNNNSPTITVDTAGNAHMAYVYVEDDMSPYITNSSNYPGRIIKYTLYYTKRVGTTWSAPVAVRTIVNNQDKLNYLGKSISKPRISVSSNGKPSLVWTEDVDSARNLSEVFFSYLNGSIWSPAANLSNNSNVGSFTWNSPTQPPENGNGSLVRLATIGTDIYATGFGYYRRLYKYSTTGNTWVTLAEVPGSVVWNGATDGDVCAYNGILYAADSSGNFISYNPSTNLWSQKTPLLTFGWGLRLRGVGGKIYAVGAGASTDLQEYNPSSNTWTKRAAMPTAREFPAVSVLNNKLQVIGGRSSSGQSLRSFEEYDPTTNTWLKKPDTNALSGMMGGADILNGKIYLTASEYAAMEVYDPNINLWMPVDRMPTRMGLGDIVVSNGNFYKISDGIFSQGVLSGQIDAIPKISRDPRIAIDSNNITHISWVDGDNEYGVDGQAWANTTTNGTISYRNFNPITSVWSPITTPLGMSITPSVSGYDFAISPDNTLHLVFKHYDSILGRDTINYVNKDSNGWGTPLIAISDYVGQISEISLSVGADGTPSIIVSNQNNPMERLFFSSLSHGIWTSPETIVSGSLVSYTPIRLVKDATGLPVVVYRQASSSSVFITKRFDNGVWSNGILANSSAQLVGVFDAVLDQSQNKLLMAYTTDFNGHSEIFTNTADLAVDYVAPAVSLTGPASGMTLSGGKAQLLSWNASDDRTVTSVSLKYSTDGGITFVDIANNLPPSGSYLWTLPNVSTNTLVVYVIASDAAGNMSTATTESLSIAGSPVLGLSVSSLSFNAQHLGTTSTPKQLTLTNSGLRKLNALAISASNEFTLSGSTCSTSLEVGASCIANIVFAPTGSGLRNGHVTIGSDALSAPDGVALSGIGKETVNPFTFVNQTGVALSSTITSAPVQITGLKDTVAWSVTGGAVCVSAGNNCSCDVTPWGGIGIIANNQYICAHHTSAATKNTSTTTEVTVGDISAGFTSSTMTPAKSNFPWTMFLPAITGRVK